MAAYLERKGKEGPITWPALRDDAEFWVECTKLAGCDRERGGAGRDEREGRRGRRSRRCSTGVAPYLKAGEIAAKVAQIIQILNNPKLAPKVKEEKAAKIVGELIATAFDLVGGKAQKRDEARAKQAAESKARVEKAREQIRSELAGAFEHAGRPSRPRAARASCRPRPAPAPIPIPVAASRARPAPRTPRRSTPLNAIGDDDFHFTADDGLHTIAMDDPEFRAPPDAPAGAGQAGVAGPRDAALDARDAGDEPAASCRTSSTAST